MGPDIPPMPEPAPTLQSTVARRPAGRVPESRSATQGRSLDPKYPWCSLRLAAPPLLIAVVDSRLHGYRGQSPRRDSNATLQVAIKRSLNGPTAARCPTDPVSAYSPGECLTLRLK